MTDMTPDPRQTTSASMRLSDYHLGAGRSKDGSSKTADDFDGDEAYGRMLEAFRRRHPPEARLTLEWGGDMIDFHAIPYDGRFGTMPTSEAAVAKLEACLSGHPLFWDSTKAFLEGEGRGLDVTIGNHDFEFVWPEVQALVRRRLGLAAGDPRVRFVTTVIDGDVCRLHGDLFDPPNATPTEDRWFIDDGFGAGAAKLLNVPYGTIMNASLGQALKARQPWIGRMKDYGAIWIWSLARDWWFGASAFLMLLAHVTYHRFFRGWRDARRKASIWTTITLLLSTTHEDRSVSRIRAFAERHPAVRVIVFGHTHLAGARTVRVGEREVICYNTGTGVEQVRFRKPQFARLFTPLPRLEAFFRRIAFYWKERPYRAVGLSAAHSAAIASPFLASRYLGWQLDEARWVIPAIAVFSLLMRQSFALYADETYSEYTPFETRTSADGERRMSLLRFHPETGTFDDGFTPEIALTP